ncbi:hypothetical protein [Flagellimonas onchidii]|uniref:hypothetical protein n=1 Tax=Flagellimonas onchidii TaxID=2562684 RepID=UPI0010A5DA3B|nr:hypothetical protein [Allomuricauda onchidii]
MKIRVLDHYNSLEKINEFLKTKTELEVSIVQDQWPTNGELMVTIGKKCVLIKKSATAGAKINLLESNTIEINPVPPSNYINNMTQRGLLAVIVDVIISGGQNKVAQEVENHLSEIQSK